MCPHFSDNVYTLPSGYRLLWECKRLLSSNFDILWGMEQTHRTPQIVSVAVIMFCCYKKNELLIRSTCWLEKCFQIPPLWSHIVSSCSGVLETIYNIILYYIISGLLTNNVIHLNHNLFLLSRTVTPSYLCFPSSCFRLSPPPLSEYFDFVIIHLFQTWSFYNLTKWVSLSLWEDTPYSCPRGWLVATLRVMFHIYVNDIQYQYPYYHIEL